MENELVTLFNGEIITANILNGREVKIPPNIIRDRKKWVQIILHVRRSRRSSLQLLKAFPLSMLTRICGITRVIALHDGIH